MEKIEEWFSTNPQVFGIVFALVGVAGLLAAIFDWGWLFKKDVSGVTYSLKKIDGWIRACLKFSTLALFRSFRPVFHPLRSP